MKNKSKGFLKRCNKHLAEYCILYKAYVHTQCWDNYADMGSKSSGGGTADPYLQNLNTLKKTIIEVVMKNHLWCHISESSHYAANVSIKYTIRFENKG